MSTYSKYDKINKEHSILLRNRLLLLFSTSFVLLITALIITRANITGGLLLSLIAVIPLILIIDKTLSLFSQTYDTKRQKEFQLQSEIYRLNGEMRSIIESIEKRVAGKQFKKSYDFMGNKAKEFEHILAIAMHHEIKEVWVTAFCKNNTVLKVTATIGSVLKCRPSDDIRNWRNHASKLKCDEIRQYHNHPVNNNHTAPSTNDLASNILLRKHLYEMKDLLKTFIVFWNNIHEYRILEYYDNGNSKISSFFDVSE